MTSAAFNLEGNRLISVDTDRVVKVWDVATVDPVQSFVSAANRRSDAPVAVSPVGPQVAVSGTPLSDEQEQNHQLIILDDMQRPLAQARLPTGNVTKLEFSPDGKRLVSCLERPFDEAHKTSHEITVWNVESLCELAPVGKPRDETCHDLAFSPDGRRLCVLWDDEITLHDATTGSE